ncbi:cell division protein FtsZ [Candidatus Wolfebacteria bacterium]|nr:MAG: cell division protein FtsZ [Candidatus Wolfebacteria bacterium]
MAKINPEIESFARIKVIGVGGGGKNTTNHMIKSKMKGVEFIAINTDTQDLHNSLADVKIHAGKTITKGLGSGMDPLIGQKAAEESINEIEDSMKGADMVFIACGMGGGTGTGGAPVIARTAKQQGILTVAVVTKPFFFEGNQRMRVAEQGIQDLEKEVDAIIVIPNDRLLAITDKDTNFKTAFAMCDQVISQAVEGISDLITTPGIINVDFADIKLIMSSTGSALMGIGSAFGKNRAEESALMAINSPLLELSIDGARGVLFSISGGDDLTIHEIQTAAKIITESIDNDAKVIFGTIKDDKLKRGEMKVTVIAAGFPSSGSSKPTLFQTSDIDTTRDESTDVSNSLPMEHVRKVEKKTEIRKQPQEKRIIIDEEEDDNWSAIPAFLRRSNKK